MSDRTQCPRERRHQIRSRTGGGARVVVGLTVAALAWSAVTPSIGAQTPPTTTTTTSTTTTTTTQPAGHLTVVPSSAAVGDTVQVTATGCATPDSDVRAGFLSQPVRYVGGVASVHADATGSFVVALTVPEALADPSTRGFQYVLAGGDYAVAGGDLGCLAPFHVTLAPTHGAVVVSPSSGPPGTVVGVALTCGFRMVATVQADVDGTPIPVVDDGQNPFDVNGALTVPAGLAPGAIVTVAGRCNNGPSAPATFTVTGAVVAGVQASAPAQAVAATPAFTG